jgi:hypothetical protein|tara:strand:- start:41 stop:172 length:132 start_codon:yes stop_codon:yes gene_type:complete
MLGKKEQKKGNESIPFVAHKMQNKGRVELAPKAIFTFIENIRM